jgi:predicted RNA binding protein YcfA (HicA-like mRNA interferase family)
VVKSESARQLAKRLKEAGFTRVSTDGRHSKRQHPSGVWVPVPDSHKTISPGVVRRVNNAIDESKRK